MTNYAGLYNTLKSRTMKARSNRGACARCNEPILNGHIYTQYETAFGDFMPPYTPREEHSNCENPTYDWRKRS